MNVAGIPVKVYGSEAGVVMVMILGVIVLVAGLARSRECAEESRIARSAMARIGNR